MSITMPRKPTPEEMATLFAVVAVTFIVLSTCGILVRRRAGTGRSRTLASILFWTGVLALAFFSLPFLYPHHHHDTMWVAGQRTWNYPIDALLGVSYWIAIGFLWRSWRR